MDASFKSPERIVLGQEPQGLTIRLVKNKLLKNWIWFAIFCMVGVALAFVYNKIAPTYYQLSSTILVKSDAKNSDLNNIFRQLNTSKSGSDIQDQVGVLRSYNLNLKTMLYFNWRYTWYRKHLITKRDLYKDEPFKLVTNPEFAQLEGVSISIKPLSATSYVVSCNQTATINGFKTKVSFENTVKFDSVFKNKYFEFKLSTLAENTEIFDKEYLLIFNNISKLALTYKDRLVVKAANAPNNSNLIVVELVTPQLARDVDYLNQLGKIYIQFGLDEKNRVANNTIKFIDDQITGVNSSLQNTGDQFSSFRSQNKTIDLRQEAALVVDKLKKIEAERGEVDLKLDYYNNLNFYLDNRDQNRDMVAPSLSGSTDNALNSTVMKLNDLYSKREVLSYTVQEKNPALISLNNEISFNQKSLRETISNLIDNANAQIANLNIRQQTVNAELSKLPKTEQDLIGIKRNFDINNELYTFLLQRRAEAEIAKASNNPDAQILDPTDSEIAILLGPIFIINIIIGLFGGLFVAAGLVIVKEMGSETLTEIDDISSQLGVSVSGSIAMSKYKTERPVYEHPRSAVTESFRGLRVNIEYMLRESKGKILAIHSIISGEGKSFVAYNIALLFAMGNKKVLLVDGDLRKPRLHLLLDTDPGKGLSSYLEGRDEIKDIIQPTDVPNLSFVPTGPTRLNSSELLYSSRVKLFIDSVRDKYDFIIFDNSPIGLLYDGILIGAQADFNLILLRLNYSKSKEINSINKIGREGILKNVMVAVNGIKLEKGYGYYTEEGGKG